MRALALLYGAVCYLVFLGAFLYLIPFIGGDMLAFAGAPKTLDWGQSPIADVPAPLINLGLLLLFGVQHTIMARQSFKRVWTQFVPTAVERSTYVLFSTLIIIALYAFWQPMPQIVWDVQSPFWSVLLTALFFLGFAIVLLSTFLINHFELFGLMQVWYRFQGRDMPQPTFRTPLLYKAVRHPLYFGWIVAFWAAPTMTVGHLLFAAVWTIYIFVALGYEERDLIHFFGDKYREYMARVPMILPFGRRKK